MKYLFIAETYGFMIQNAINELRKQLKSQPEVYSEYLEATKDYLNSKMTLEVVEKRRVPWSSVISEYKNFKILYNPKKWFYMSFAEKAGNLCHEAFHALGFTHSFRWTKERKYSIPYFMGYWVEYYSESPKPDFNVFLTILSNRK